MTRTHIHKYRTRYHVRATYSKAIRARGELVVTQGQVGTLLDATLIGEADPGAQADQACRNIKHGREEAGGRLADVVELTDYVTERSHRAPVYETLIRWFEDVHHCSTGVVVDGLTDPAMLVEFDAMAVIGDESQDEDQTRDG